MKATKIFLPILLIAIFIGCGGITTPEPTGSVSIAVSDTIQLGALFVIRYVAPLYDVHGTGNPPTWGFEITGSGTTNNYGGYVANPIGAASNTGNYDWVGSYRISDLKEGVTYSVRGYATISGTKYYSNTVQFTTTAQPKEWVRLADYPGNNSGISNSCMIGGGCCFGFGDLYSPKTNSWTALPYKQISPDPGSQNPSKTGAIFMISGLFFRYSGSDITETGSTPPTFTAVDTSTLKTYPYGTITGSIPILFTIGDTIYYGGSTEFWKTTPSINTIDRWHKLNDLPMKFSNVYFSNSCAGRGYLALNNTSGTKELWEYNPAQDSWTKKAAPPVNFYSSPSNCADAGRIYVLSNGLWAYTQSNDSWNLLDNHLPADGTLGTDGTTIYLMGISNFPLFDNRFWKYAP